MVSLLNYLSLFNRNILSQFLYCLNFVVLILFLERGFYIFFYGPSYKYLLKIVIFCILTVLSTMFYLFLIQLKQKSGYISNLNSDFYYFPPEDLKELIEVIYRTSRGFFLISLITNLFYNLIAISFTITIENKNNLLEVMFLCLIFNSINHYTILLSLNSLKMIKVNHKTNTTLFSLISAISVILFFILAIIFSLIKATYNPLFFFPLIS